jgi:hypothetical protein
MYPRRGFHDRLHAGIEIDGGDFVDLIYVVVRWLVTALVNGWQS